jgi:hypothetical protein
MLIRSGYELCFLCHGSLKRGVPGEASTDIEAVFAKASVHPVLTTAHYHRRGEVLPEKDSSAPRHVSCQDCHVVHTSRPDWPWKGARGYSPARRLKRATQEYELCYLCHSDSENRPAESENLLELFDPLNPSYHPIERPGRNKNVPSLTRDWTVNDRIRCTHCHGNDDPYGPRGPHGSDYPPILLRRYIQEDGPESPSAYELCYGCHDRRSILGDESFKKHKLHVVYQNTSCATCHTAHGSREYPYLIRFNPSVVEPGPDGGPEFQEAAPGKPRCYLSCHGAEHTLSGVEGRSWEEVYE